ncbi:hypothetical protein [Flavobacterium kingsejongi]|uniref:Uncharacterized protein n=1 Tax=Flavobacterium kingsejongi TaxID=1678728 RepID=A0A2S1LTA4_9FLAO|nr:hypothetical protein [Flavobacterium kingsejongi]AWG26983.1 hypothetical protein FK004_17955 [Flavobacterium kingsejongi]
MQQTLNEHADAIAVNDGLTLIANQAAQEIELRNSAGDILATLNVSFLNNEGTEFRFNQTTNNLELWNDQGEMLSAVPVGSFVTNVAKSINFKSGQANVLELKDTAGNVLSFVNFNIVNISGLQSALDSKISVVAYNGFVSQTNDALESINGNVTSLIAQDIINVKTQGNQVVQGIKDFVGGVTVPVATTAGQAVRFSQLQTVESAKANINGSNVSPLSFWNIVSQHSNGLGGYAYSDQFVPNSDISSIMIRSGNQSTWKQAGSDTIRDWLNISSVASNNVVYKSLNQDIGGQKTFLEALTVIGIVKCSSEVVSESNRTGSIVFKKNSNSVDAREWVVIPNYSSTGTLDTIVRFDQSSDNFVALTIGRDGHYNFKLPVSLPDGLLPDQAINLRQLKSLVQTTDWVNIPFTPPADTGITINVCRMRLKDGLVLINLEAVKIGGTSTGGISIPMNAIIDPEKIFYQILNNHAQIVDKGIYEVILQSHNLTLNFLANQNGSVKMTCALPIAKSVYN